MAGHVCHLSTAFLLAYLLALASASPLNVYTPPIVYNDKQSLCKSGEDTSKEYIEVYFSTFLDGPALVKAGLPVPSGLENTYASGPKLERSKESKLGTGRWCSGEDNTISIPGKSTIAVRIKAVEKVAVEYPVTLTGPKADVFIGFDLVDKQGILLGCKVQVVIQLVPTRFVTPPPPIGKVEFNQSSTYIPVLYYTNNFGSTHSPKVDCAGSFKDLKVHHTGVWCDWQDRQKHLCKPQSNMGNAYFFYYEPQTSGALSTLEEDANATEVFSPAPAPSSGNGGSLGSLPGSGFFRAIWTTIFLCSALSLPLHVY